jgi:adenylate cyclase class 2
MEFMEIEVKFLLDNVDKTRQRILDMGGETSGRVFEINIRFEDAGNKLIQQHSLLRLRKDKTSTLTFKSLAGSPGDQFKIHKEIEVEVSDFNATAAILESLGYHQEQIYEKYRETFKLQGAVLCLDTMPFGNFLEIEGNRDNIRSAADRIGLVWENRILNNYFGLFAMLRNSLGLPFSDITFDNFQQTPIDREVIAQLLERETTGRKQQSDKDG